MIKNLVGPPVRGKDLFGRDAFVQLVSDKLRDGHILLAAPRRFGKTSVMYRLIDEPLWDYHIVHADLERMIDPADLVAHLLEQLAKNTKLAKFVKGLSWLPKEALSLFRENIEEVELFEVKLKLKEQLRHNWQESGEDLFRKIASFGSTIVFILDEFPVMIDRMARKPERREEAITLLNWLRALRLDPKIRNVRFLIAGSIGIGQVLNELGQIASINDFEQVRLEPFSPKVASDFLDALAKGAKLQLSPACKKKILAVVGTPVPYFIQIVFSEVAKAHSLHHEPITPKLIERIYHQKVLGVDCKTYFEHYYGRLRDYYNPHEELAVKRILRELALVGEMTRDACYQFYREKIGASADLEDFNRLMADLENDFYVRYDEQKRRYEFACKVLRDWWLRHYGMEI